MTAPINFLEYSLPDYGFSTGTINNFPKVQPLFVPKPIIYNPPVIQPIEFDSDSIFQQPQVAYTPPIKYPRYVQPVVTTQKTISFTVKDNTGIIPGANIEVNGVGKAVSDDNGRVILPNVSIDASIRISYMGFDDYVGTVSTS